MNYKKIILVGFISAFVAVLTSVLGVTGTVIGSVISSVLYNMLSEAPINFGGNLEMIISSGTFIGDIYGNFYKSYPYVYPSV